MASCRVHFFAVTRRGRCTFVDGTPFGFSQTIIQSVYVILDYVMVRVTKNLPPDFCIICIKSNIGAFRDTRKHVINKCLDQTFLKLAKAAISLIDNDLFKKIGLTLLFFSSLNSFQFTPIHHHAFTIESLSVSKSHFVKVPGIMLL